MARPSESENWFQQRARHLAQGRDEALQAGRDAWNQATRTGYDLAARTEAEVEALGRQMLAQKAAVANAGRQVIAPVRSAMKAVDDAQAVRLKADQAAGRQAVRTVGQVKSALFNDHQPTEPAPKGPPDLGEVDRRMLETQNELRRNYQLAAITPLPGATALAWPVAVGSWLNKVRPHGAWDNKDTTNFNEGEFQGNFNYGATATTLGIPKEAALRGAGAVQRLQNVQRAFEGKPFAPSVGGRFFGDDPRDQPAVSQGWDYGRAQLSRRR